jgi:ubiquinone/menaquinone biosynthesis C-methylase UbiE
MFLRKWQEVYERLPLERKDKTLTEISGFDKFCSDYAAFRKTVFADLLEDSGIRKGARVCEVGCGCGDKLGLFYGAGYRCSGVDYSRNMIQRAKQEMPLAELHVVEAAKLPFPDNSMDLVFAYSVFIYFEDWPYARQALEEMVRVAKSDACVCVWDVPDIKEKARVESFRGAAQAGYEHTYYDMNDFIQWFKEKNVKLVRAGYKPMPFYKHSYFRFNVTAKLDKKA